MRTLLLAAWLLLLTGCGGAKAGPAGPKQPPATSAMATPVIAPMQARERLLHDLDIQKQNARDRATTLDGVIERDR